MKKILFLFSILLCSLVFAKPLFNSFNSGELSPLMKYRVDLDKRQMGVETMENMTVKPQGAAFRRPGTIYVGQVLGVPQDVNWIGHRLELLVHARGSEHLSQTDDVPTTLWRSTTDNGAFGCDIAIDGNSIVSQHLLDVDDPSPLLLFDVDGNDLEVDFEFSNAAGDLKLATSGNMHDCRFSPEGDYVYLVQRCAQIGGDDEDTRVHRYSVDGTRIWRVGWHGNRDTCSTIAVGPDGDLYIPAAGVNGVNNYPRCLDPIDGSENIAYTTVELRGESKNSCISETLNKVYFCSYVNSNSTPANVIVLGLDLDSNSVAAVSYCSATGGYPRQICTDHNAVFVYGINGDFNTNNIIKLNGTTLALEAQTNISYACRLWIDWDGNVAVGVENGSDDKVTVLSPDDLSEIATYTTNGDWCQGNGLGKSRRASYYGWPQSNQVVCKVHAHGYSNGDKVSFSGVGGTTELNGNTYDVNIIDSNYFFLEDTNFDDFSDFTSGGSVSTLQESRIRLIPFEYSTTDAYVLALVNEGMAFFRTDVNGDSGQILDSNDDYYFISTVYDQNELRGIHYIQKNDVMYLTHPNHPVQKLSRYDHDYWTIADVNWVWGPFLDENTTTTTVTPSGTTGSITLIASSDIFDGNHVGALWKITEKSDNTAIDGLLDANESSSTVTIEGEGLLTLKGTWQGLVTLEKSDDEGSNWEPVYSNLDGKDENIEYSFNEESPGFIYRVTMSQYTSGTAKYWLVAYNTDVSGYVEITAYTDANEVTATVRSKLAGTAATTKWSEGAWSDYRGYPRAICLYQNRLCLAGTSYMPNGFWTSVSGDPENMRESSLDSGAIVYEVGSAKQNPILWLQDKQGIIAGTSGSIIRIFSQSNTSTLTPASIGSERQSQAGSCNIQAQLIGDSIVFVDRNYRKVRDLIYDLESDNYVSPELTIFAEHITDPCLVEVAIQQRPDPILWYIRSDGKCVPLTYNRDQSVVAWTRCITGDPNTEDDFESVAVIPGKSQDEDEVWFVIKRTIDSNEVRYIEKLKEQDWGTDPNFCWFVDSGLEYTGTATNILTGLSHLDAEYVQVFHDGNEYETVLVVDGNVSLDCNVTHAIAGLGFTTTLQTFPVELPMQTGFTVGYKKKIYEICGCFYKTMYGEYGLVGQFTDATMYPIPFNYWPDSSLGSDLPYTGQIRLPIDGGWDDEVRIKFTQDEPYPFNLTALITKIEISEN